MPAGTEQIHLQILHIKGNLSKGLNRIRVEQNPLFPGHGSNFGYGLHRTDFIVCVHNTDQYGVRSDRPAQLLQIHQSILIHLQISNLKSLFFQMSAGMKHRVMLNCRGDNVPALMTAGACRPLQGPVIRLGASRREKNLLLSCSDSRSQCPSGLIQRLFRCGPHGMDRAGISVIFF